MNRDQILGMLDIDDGAMQLPENKLVVSENIVVNGNVLIKKGSVIEIQEPKKK